MNLHLTAMTRNILFLMLCSLSLIAKGQPYAGFVYPAGGKQGTSFLVTVGGQGIQNVTGVHFSNKGITGEFIQNLPNYEKTKFKQIRDQDNKQLEERVSLKVSVNNNVRPGLYDLRLVNADGISNRLFFEVGQLIEVNERMHGDSGSTVSFVGPLPIEVNGQILPGEKDTYRFHARENQKIVCAVKARILAPFMADAVPGWFQPIITLYNEEGEEVAFNDDFQNQPDPVLLYEVEKTGNYSLVIHDAIFRGRSDFVYRITIGEVPYLYSVFPMGGKAGEETTFTLKGVNLKEKEHVVNLPGNSQKIWISGMGKGDLLSNSRPLVVGNIKEILEKDNNNSMDKAQSVYVPSSINGIIDEEDDEDWFKFEVNKGKSLSFKVAGRSLNSPVDALLTLYDSGKNQVVFSDDFTDRSNGMAIHHADPMLIHKFNKGGTYFVRITDIQNKGGGDYSYRLTIEPPKPDFELRIEPSNLLIPKGGSAAFKVHAIRKAGFNGAINVSVKNLPEGLVCKKRTINRGQQYVQMSINAPRNTPLGPIKLDVEGTSKQNETVVKRRALPAEEKMQAFIYLHLLPTADFPVMITKPKPYGLGVSVLKDSCDFKATPKKMAVQVKLNYYRTWKRPVRLQLHNPVQGMRMKPVTLQPGETEAKVEIEFFNIRKQNDYSPIIKGVSFAGRDKNNKRNTMEVLSPVIPVSPEVFEGD